MKKLGLTLLLTLVLSGFLAVIQPQTTLAAGKIECPELKITGTEINTIACMMYDATNLVAWFNEEGQNTAGIFNLSNSKWEIAFYFDSKNPISVDFIDNTETRGILFSTEETGQYYFVQSEAVQARNGWYLLKQAELDKLKLESKLCPVFTYHDEDVKTVGCFILKYGITMNFSISDVYHMFLEREGRVDQYWNRTPFTAWRDESGNYGFIDTNNINSLIPQDSTQNYRIDLSKPA